MIDIKSIEKIAVVCGGNSAEREISIISGEYVQSVLETIHSNVCFYNIEQVDAQFIEQLKKTEIDLVVIMLHGGDGENGKLQYLLEQANIAYTGSDSASCKRAMDKVVTKQIWSQHNIPSPAFKVINEQDCNEMLLEVMGGATVIKPSCEGSSNGVSIVSATSELSTAYDIAQPFINHGSQVMAEAFVKGREITYGIIDDQVLPPIEIKVANGFYDYNNKYLTNKTQYICPAEIDQQLDKRLRELSLKAYQSLGCSHWGRVDLILSDDQPHFIEVNTVPGMTSKSLVPKAAIAYGWTIEYMLQTIVSIGMQRWRNANAL